MIEIPKFKIRCSQIGKIMTEPRSKKDREAGELSETAKSYCKMWLKQVLYNRQKEITSKYTAKGNTVEDDSIQFIGRMLDLGIVFKNDEYFEDEYKHGTPDMLPLDQTDLIIDAKNSWGWDTFPLFEDKLPESDYYWQAMGYMDLTGRHKYKVVYCLSDTPEYLIEREARSYCYNNGYMDLDGDIYLRFEQQMTYSDIPDEMKIKSFDLEYNRDEVLRIHDQVNKCRKYIKTLLK